MGEVNGSLRYYLELMQESSSPLNRAGLGYVIGSVVLSSLVVFVLVALVSGLWRVSVFWMPRAVIAYTIGKFATNPLAAWISTAVTAILIGGSAFFARRRAVKVETFVGDPKDDVTAVTGVLLLLGDVTKGVVITIIEMISD
jgi:nitrate reductase gamma subunit